MYYAVEGQGCRCIFVWRKGVYYRYRMTIPCGAVVQAVRVASAVLVITQGGSACLQEPGKRKVLYIGGEAVLKCWED